METRASYTAVGAVVLVLLAGLALFSVWLSRLQVSEDRQTYWIYFEGDVTGLNVGGTVRYNGIRVGSVTEVALDREVLNRVRVAVDLPADLPVHANGAAALESGGIGGPVFIQISGGSPEAPLLRPGPDGAPPVIPSRTTGLAQLLDEAPELLASLRQVSDRAQAIVSPQNAAAISGILADVRIATGNFAAASDDVRVAAAAARRTVAEVERAAREIAGATEGLDGTLAAVSDDVRRAAAAAAAAAERLGPVLEEAGGLLAELRGPIVAFANQSLPEVSRLIADLRDTAAEISAFAVRLERNPSGTLLRGPDGGIAVPR